MGKLLRFWWQDWARAPISGTIVILAALCGLLALNRGQIEAGVLFMIYAKLEMMTRGPFDASQD